MFSFNANTYSSSANGAYANTPQNYIQNSVGKHSLTNLAHNTNKTASLVPGTPMRASYLDKRHLRPAPGSLLSASSSKVPRYEYTAQASDPRNKPMLDIHRPRVTFRETLVTGGIESVLPPAHSQGIRADMKKVLWNSGEELNNFRYKAYKDAKEICKGGFIAKFIESRGIELYLDKPRYEARKAYRNEVMQRQEDALLREYSPQEVTDKIAKWSVQETAAAAAHARSVGEQDHKAAKQSPRIIPDCLSTVLCAQSLKYKPLNTKP